MNERYEIYMYVKKGMRSKTKRKVLYTDDYQKNEKKKLINDLLADVFCMF